MPILAVVGAVLLLMVLFQLFVHPIATLRALTRILCGIVGAVALIAGVFTLVGGEILGLLILMLGVILLVCANRLSARRVRQ